MQARDRLARRNSQASCGVAPFDKPFRRTDMLKWALIFALVALVAGALGFGGVAGAAAGVAKILFFLFLVGFLVFLVLGVMAGRKLTGR
jgi:uncharacterized membrane protein YtjA (UPF0391 family)